MYRFNNDMAAACSLPLASLQSECTKGWRKFRKGLRGTGENRSSMVQCASTPTRNAKGRRVWLQNGPAEHSDVEEDPQSGKAWLWRSWEKNSDAFSETSSTTNLTGQADRDRTGPLPDEQFGRHSSARDSSSRFSFQSAKSAVTSTSNDTITPKTMGVAHPREPESTLDPWLATNAFDAPVSRFSSYDHPRQRQSVELRRPIDPSRPINDANSLGSLINAFPIPAKLGATHCVQLRMPSKRSRLVQSPEPLEGIPKRRSRLFLRPTSGDY